VTEFILAWVIGVAVIIGLAFALPCNGCRLRRERLQRAYDDWKKSRSGR
jgi:hypothetical protein